MVQVRVPTVLLAVVFDVSLQVLLGVEGNLFGLFLAETFRNIFQP